VVRGPWWRCAEIVRRRPSLSRAGIIGVSALAVGRLLTMSLRRRLMQAIRAGAACPSSVPRTATTAFSCLGLWLGCAAGFFGSLGRFLANSDCVIFVAVVAHLFE
jgi:hypothetical protein